MIKTLKNSTFLMIQNVNSSMIFRFLLPLFSLLVLGRTSQSQNDSSSEVQISMQFKKGWNLLSFPVPPTSFDKDLFFAGLAIGELWTFNNRQFNKTESVESGKAYWVYLKENLNLMYPFNPNEIDTQRESNAGWNLFAVSSATPILIPTDAVGPVWHWENGCYRTAKDLLFPGIGYWISSEGPFFGHVKSIRFGQTWDYGQPSDSLTFKMEIEITTDSTALNITVDTPSGTSYEMTQLSVNDNQIQWNVQQNIFNNQTDLENNFGDGTYNFIFTFSDGKIRSTNVSTNIPAQPKQEPIPIQEINNAELTLPIELTWQAVDDPALIIDTPENKDIFLTLVGQDGNKTEIRRSIEDTSHILTDLNLGLWEFGISFSISKAGNTTEGVPYVVSKVAKSNHAVSITPNWVPYDDFNDNDFDFSKWTGINENGGDFPIEEDRQVKLTGKGNALNESRSKILITNTIGISGIRADITLSKNSISDACINLIVFFDSEGSAGEDLIAWIDLCRKNTVHSIFGVTELPDLTDIFDQDSPNAFALDQSVNFAIIVVDDDTLQFFIDNAFVGEYKNSSTNFSTITRLGVQADADGDTEGRYEGFVDNVDVVRNSESITDYKVEFSKGKNGSASIDTFVVGDGTGPAITGVNLVTPSGSTVTDIDLAFQDNSWGFREIGSENEIFSKYLDSGSYVFDITFAKNTTATLTSVFDSSIQYPSTIPTIISVALNPAGDMLAVSWDTVPKNVGTSLNVRIGFKRLATNHEFEFESFDLNSTSFSVPASGFVPGEDYQVEISFLSGSVDKSINKSTTIKSVFSEAFDFTVNANSLYKLLDISDGPTASTYPVTDLNAKPTDLLTNPEYKTTKILLRRILAGTFFMGAPETDFCKHDGEIYHQVTLTQDFYIGVFEVTQRQWELVMNTAPSSFNGNDSRPVEQVNWNDDIRGGVWPLGSPSASTFMGILQAKTGRPFDLPTEAQWEYAARAGSTKAYHNDTECQTRDVEFDSNLEPLAWYFSNSGDRTHDVGLKMPNSWGLYDTSGNVWELCLDRYRLDLGTSPVTDPVGPSFPLNGARTIRGGVFNNVAWQARSASRKNFFGTTSRVRSVGFRLALPTGQ